MDGVCFNSKFHFAGREIFDSSVSHERRRALAKGREKRRGDYKISGKSVVFNGFKELSEHTVDGCETPRIRTCGERIYIYTGECIFRDALYIETKLIRNVAALRCINR